MPRRLAITYGLYSARVSYGCRQFVSLTSQPRRAAPTREVAAVRTQRRAARCRTSGGGDGRVDRGRAADLQLELAALNVAGDARLRARPVGLVLELVAEVSEGRVDDRRVGREHRLVVRDEL